MLEYMATTHDLEKLVLRVLCVGTREGPVKEELIPPLRGYHWQVRLHQIIFRAIAAIGSDDPAVLRELLPAKLTRLGFPDVEWEEFFASHSLSREESIALAKRLVTET